MDLNQPCTNCGCTKPHHDAIERAMNEKFELGLRFRRMGAEHGERAALWELEKISLQEGMKYMQRKVRAQAAHLRKLEAKLRKLGKQPYEEDLLKAPEITGM